MSSPPLAASIPVHCAHHAIVPIHELRPNPANPNRHPDRQLLVYAAAILQRGWREAVTVSNRSGFIVSGHGAVEAARRIPTDMVPVEYQDYESEEEELADLIAHNRLPELAATDGEKLADALLKLGGVGCDLVTGFSDADLAKIFAEAKPVPQYPVVAKLNEAHRMLCIAVDSETDWIFLKALAGVKVQRSYKNSTVGEGHVVLFPEFIASLRENLHSIASAS